MPYATQLGIPAPTATFIKIRIAPYPNVTDFDPLSWRHIDLTPQNDGWWVLDIPACTLPDGTYQYDFVVQLPEWTQARVVPDPFAEDLVKLSGYRSLMHIAGGQRVRPAFSWADELPPGGSLPQNNQLVIYELPMRWVDAPEDAVDRQVDLGTFDKAIFEHLQYIADIGCNAIELLPVQDSPDTLNWGYGTRFFYAPDFDMGSSFELKLFIKRCHQKGIRVILDVVMNHARKCPLRDLAYPWYFGKQENRNDWGGDLFLYNNPVVNSFYPAREWHYAMAGFWIEEYRIDGFRIDEFSGIQNWDFLQAFRNHVWTVQQTIFPGRPFIVIGEDSARRPEVAQDIATTAGKVADSIWDFDFRDEVRQICSNTMYTKLGEPSRRERVRGIIQGDGLMNGGEWRTMWNSQIQMREKARFTDLSQRIVYVTSHDVGGAGEQRLYTYLLQKYQDQWGVDWSPLAAAGYNAEVVEQLLTAFVLMLTTPGIPMFLAGEEFADLHDLPPSDWHNKMSDPINWGRLGLRTHKDIGKRTASLIQLRKSTPSLQRNEVTFFGFNDGFSATFDENEGERVFAYCRNGNQPPGAGGQVAVVCNVGPRSYPQFSLRWPWGNRPVTEYGQQENLLFQIAGNDLTLELKPFQTRTFQIW